MKKYKEMRNWTIFYTFVAMYSLTHGVLDLSGTAASALFWAATWIEWKNYVRNPCLED